MLPRWRALVWDPLRSSGVPPAAATAMLAAFGTAYNVHAHVQARAFAQEGVVAVGLANAVRCALPSSASAGRRSHLQVPPAECAYTHTCTKTVQYWLHAEAAPDHGGWEGSRV